MAQVLKKEDREKLIEKVGEYFVNTKASYREISKEFGISLPTVKDYIYRYKSMHPSVSAKMEDIIGQRKTDNQSINNANTLSRIMQVYEYILEGKTIKDIAAILNESEQTIYNDINLRLRSLDEERFLEVKKIFEQRRLNNLSQNKNDILK